MAQKKLSELAQRLKKLATTSKQYADEKVSAIEPKLFVKGTANQGYLKTYIIAKGADTKLIDGDVPSEKKIGEIDIPKDFLVKDAKMLTVVNQDGALLVTEENGVAVSPYPAPAPITSAGHWADLVVNTKGDAEAETASHLCFDLTKLVDVYTNGDGLNLSNGVFSIKLKSSNSGLAVDATGLSISIDATNANGLVITANGLKLNKATQSSAGAQSAEDKLLEDQIRSDIQLMSTEEIISWFGYDPTKITTEGTAEKALNDIFTKSDFADSITPEE